ncbi:MAG: ATP-binding cassette domain-containing protein [Chlamydiales bacterium]
MTDRRKNVAEIKRLLEEKKELLPRVTDFLIAKGVQRSLAAKIGIEFVRERAEIGTLPAIITRYIRTSPDLDFRQKRCIALVGPTGVGKSTTILKLAGLYRDKKVGILALDKEKAGTSLQFEKGIIGNNVSLHEGIEKTEGYDLILLDTGGCNFYEEGRVDALGELLTSFPSVEVHLTLSAATKDVDLYGAIHQFSPLQPTHLIFTKLDETLTLGSLINVCAKTELPIRYITYGYPLPGKIEIAEPKNIVKKMLANLNAKEFQILRYLSLN